ncbi:MAG: CBS domain-containing protein [Candidatus Eisenbacteria bacterium]|nr:CBS domain-containing protein [Candidatus Eisenbacteria bacterium]
MKVVATLLSVLTLAAFFFFLLAHRARTLLWLDSGDGSLQFDDEKIEKRNLASGGLYLLEISALTAACYLLSLSLHALGLTKVGVWILSPGTAFLATLVLAPFLLRRAGREAKAGQGMQAGRGQGAAAHTKSLFLSEAVLAIAERLRRILIGAPGRTGDARGKAVNGGSGHGKEVLRLLLRLRERRISEVMVPRTDMVCAEDSSSVSEVADLVREASYTRIPIFSGTIDSITGYVTAKDVVIRLHQGGGADAVSSIARKPVFVGSDATIEHALEQMQKARATLAIVTGPSGKVTGQRVARTTGQTAGPTMGLVTGEDILEEVVGDFYENYEPEEPAYQVIDDRTAIVKANVALGDLKEIFGVVPSGNLSQTLGDYVRKQLGAEPFKGERVSDEVFSYSVAKTTGKAIWSLKVEKRN